MKGDGGAVGVGAKERGSQAYGRRQRICDRKGPTPQIPYRRHGLTFWLTLAETMSDGFNRKARLERWEHHRLER